MDDVMLFSGSSNVPLAREISRLLRIPLGNVELTRFIDNESRVFVKDRVSGKHIFVVQSLSEVADQHLVELCLLGQALKSLNAAEVTAVIPWMGYSKQDKAFRKGEAVSAQLVAKFIEVAGFTGVITCELHSENILPYFRIPLVELPTHKLFISILRQKIIKSAVVVSPDQGGKTRSESFAREAGLPIAYVAKKRDPESGSVTVTGISGDVKRLNCIIFDDIINSGATAIKISKYLKEHGAGDIFLLATHAVLAGDAPKHLASSPIKEVIVTDSILVPQEKQFSKLRTVSVAPILVNAISGVVR